MGASTARKNAKRAQSAEAAARALEGARTEALGMLRDQLAKIETLHHHVDALPGSAPADGAADAWRRTAPGYESGKTGFLELVTSQRALLETESMYRQHLTDLQAAYAELEALVGADLQLFPSKRCTRIEREMKRSYLYRCSVACMLSAWRPDRVATGKGRKVDPNGGLLHLHDASLGPLA